MSSILPIALFVVVIVILNLTTYGRVD